MEDLKAELVQTLQDRIDRLVISQAADPMDQIRNSTEQELDSRSISLLTRRLRRIEDALRAIRDGTFGLARFAGVRSLKNVWRRFPGRSIA